MKTISVVKKGIKPVSSAGPASCCMASLVYFRF
jgi:hypothetical protein